MSTIGNISTIIGGNDLVTEAEARSVAELLCPLILAAPEHGPAVEALRAVVQRMDTESALTVYLDWWLVVTTAAPSPQGKAYHLPEEIPHTLRGAMADLVALRDSGLETTAVRWLELRDRFLEDRSRVDELLDITTYGKTALPNERRVWESLQAQLFEVADALRDDQPADDPDVDFKAYERALSESSIADGSRRWREMQKRSRECVDGFSRLVELQRLVEPWRPRRPPDPLDAIPDDVGGQLGDLAGILLQPLLEGEQAGGLAVSDHAIGKAVEDLAATLDDRSRAWLASVASAWIDETEATVPSLSPVVERRRSLEQRIEALEAGGLDLDIAEIHLLDHDLDAAARAIDEASTQRRQARRADTIRSSIERLRASKGDGEAEATRLSEAEQRLDAGEIAAAQSIVQELEVELRETTRRSALDRLTEIQTELESHNAPANAIDEIAQQIDQLTNRPDRPLDASMLERAERRLEALQSERADTVSQIVVDVHDRLDSESELFSPEDFIDLDSRLTRVEDLQDDDPAAAYKAAIELINQIEALQIQSWYEEDGEDVLVEHLLTYCSQELHFAEEDVRRVHVACKTKPFVILAGLTGSGKSTLARLYAAAIGANADSERFRRVAVRPDWIDQTEVLGTVNPINNRFQPGWLAEIALRCAENADQLHFVLLDEMNLAPVEQYLAEYLSALEEARSGSDSAGLQLYQPGVEPENGPDWPPSLPFPSNLVVLGTVNVDETTRAMSERVLDRANVIQLSVRISDAHHHRRTQAVQPLHVPFSEWQAICRTEPDPDHHDFLIEIGEILQRVGIGIGQRSHTELERFVANAIGVLDPVVSLDLGVLQRIIPKIRGFKRDLQPELADLREVLDSTGCDRSAAVVAGWLDDSVSDDEFLDGTDARIGLLR